MNVQKRVGEEARHQIRIKHIEAIRHKSAELLAVNFPTPVTPPSESDFLSGWDNFNQSLIDTFGQQKDYRLAFNHGVDLIKKYQQKHNWEYSPPSHLITNKPSAQLRTPRWLKGAWALYDSYQVWKDTSIQKKSENVSFRYQSLLLSLLIDSGHCHIDILKSFNKLLQTTPKLILQSFSGYTFVSLKLNSERINSNDYLDGNPVTTYQCYLSLKTLGQLRLWQKLNKRSWQYPTDTKKLFAIMVNGLPTHKDIPTTAQAFCSCAAFLYEQHGNLDISEALLEYRTGRTRSYSLPLSNLKRLISPTLTPVQPASFYDFSSNVTVSHKYKRAFKLNEQTLRENQFIGKLKSACTPKNNDNKVSSETVRKRLEALLTQYKLAPWQQVFIQWLIHKTTSCSAKTVNQYMLNQIKYWCLINNDNSLSSLSSSVDIEERYQEQINNHSTIKSQKYYSARLKDLHAFALPLMALPAISESFFSLDAGKSHTRAGVVDEYLFKGLLKHIEQLTDINNIDRLALQTICIISYRCALRMTELYKLKINNVENSATGWIEIRPNNLGDNKTASGLRKLPLFPLLLEDESKIVSEYISYKKRLNLKKTAPLLTIGEDILRPFSMFTVSNYVGEVLRALSSENHLVFYHLRHSCISRLQLMLEFKKPQSILPHFYPYSQEQNDKIKRLLFKKGLSYGYWEIAAFAGHESPHVTFNHYFHLSDLLATPSIDPQTPISWKEAQSQGLCSRRQYQALLKKNKTVTQGDCFTILEKSLHIKDITKQVKQVTTDSISLTPPSKEIINLNICYKVLVAISNGQQINALAYHYRLKQNTIDTWFVNAQYLKHLNISANNKVHNEYDQERFSRHFSRQRIHCLVPGRLKTVKEIKYANQFVKLLRDNYKDNAESITDMMIYCLTHTSINKSGITFNTPSQMKNFIEMFQFAIPKSHWRAVKLYINTSIIKDEWQTILKGMTTTEEKRGTKSGRSGKGSIRLELISPSEKQYTNNGKISKYSSHMLIYLMYMSFVLLRKLPSN